MWKIGLLSIFGFPADFSRWIECGNVIALSATYILTVWLFFRFFSSSWSSGAQNWFIGSRDGVNYFRRVILFFISCRNSTSGRVSTSGIAAELRPPSTCDLRTLVEVVSVRLSSPESVITGVGTSSRAADTEIDSLGRLLRPTSHAGTVSMVFFEFYG